MFVVLTYPLTHLLTDLLTYLLTYSLTHLLTYSLTYLRTYSLTYSLTDSLAYLFNSIQFHAEPTRAMMTMFKTYIKCDIWQRTFDK